MEMVPTSIVHKAALTFMAAPQNVEVPRVEDMFT
jgi:hypothetical protein